MGSVRSPCMTSYRLSIDTIALNCLLFENIAFFAFWRQTEKQTDEQKDSTNALSRAGWCEQRLNNTMQYQPHNNVTVTQVNGENILLNLQLIGLIQKISELTVPVCLNLSCRLVHCCSAALWNTIGLNDWTLVLCLCLCLATFNRSELWCIALWRVSSIKVTDEFCWFGLLCWHQKWYTCSMPVCRGFYRLPATYCG